MSDATPWTSLKAELDRWAAAGRQATFWLRDDDAVAPTPALDRLLDLTAHHAVPLVLAVIPRDSGAALARRLDAAPQVSVAVHGWSHENHAPAGEKKQELGRHRPASAVLGELGAGIAELRTLHGDRLLPLLVPPWNRIDPALLPQLPGLGYAALSVYGPELPAPLPMLNTHVDLIDWHGSRSLRDEPLLIADILERLARIETGGGALGLLTHHLVHDARVSGFLDRLLALTARHPACSWPPPPRLVGG